MRRRYRILLAILVLVGVPYYWLLIDNHARHVPHVRLDLAEMRRLAESVPGAKPDGVRVEAVASRQVPGTLLVSGGGLMLNKVSVHSFLLTGGEGDIVIDSGLSRGDARALGFRRYSPASQARIEAAMRRARLILFTHEHIDHVGGFLGSPAFPGIAGKALLTPEQLAGGLPWPPGGRALIRPFSYQRMAAVAPGVVLIHTPGHTPGSQMVFVRLAGGGEVLFAGDTATMARSWLWGRARSRLVADFVTPEDRGAVLGWLRALQELKRQAPALVIVPGHDHREISGPRNRSGIGQGFGDPRPAAQGG